jgi:type I restriction enzyme S subunit
MEHREGGSAGMRAGWEVKSLGEVCEVVNGGTPKTNTPEYWDGDIQWITPAEMGKRQSPFVSVTNRTLTSSGLQNSSARKIPSHSVILSTRAPIGHLVINTVPMATNQGCRGLIPHANLNTKFLYYFLSCNVDLLNELGTGTTFKELSSGKLKEVRVPLPPLAEQQRIVAILDEAFEGIATARKHAEQNLQNAKALFESHLYKNHTEKTLLGHIVNIKTGKLDANAATVDGLYPFFTCSRETYRTDTYAFDCEAILLAGNNAVGDFNVKHYLGRFNAYQRTYVITAIDDTKVHNRFLYFQILKGLKKFKSQSVGSGTKFLKLDMIKELDIELPTIAEQINITASLDALRDETNRLCDIYTQKIAALDALKKSLLHQAFSGEL